jgi:hypothetical protein
VTTWGVPQSFHQGKHRSVGRAQWDVGAPLDLELDEAT